MSKAHRVHALRIEGPDGLDPHYAGWFACFNRGAYYEAHDVLEALWLGQRGQANDRFYKGLIQLAGAFVHLQKNRLRPADALFRLAAANLELYPSRHERLRVSDVLDLIADWRRALDAGGFESNPLPHRPVPVIHPEPSIELRVRAGQDRDLPRLPGLFRASILGLARADYDADQLAAWAGRSERLLIAGRLLGESRETLVAELGEDLAAFLTFDAEGHIDMLYTHPDHARRGAASALLAAAEASLCRRGTRRAYTEASRTARPFFERHGYVVVVSQDVTVEGQRLNNFRMEKVFDARD